MNRERARQVLEESLGRGSNTPCTWAPDRAAYIAEYSDRLRQVLIDPVLVTVLRSAHDTDLLGRLSPCTVYALARTENHWLLYIEEFKEFALAFGSSERELSVIGFSSDDALAEWLG